MIAFHCGAGYHDPKNHDRMKDDLKKLLKSLSPNDFINLTSKEVLKSHVNFLSQLENLPWTAAGVGKSCDASVLALKRFSSIAAVPNSQYSTIKLAYQIFKNEKIPDKILSGKKALDLLDLEAARQENLQQKLPEEFMQKNKTSDTVGSICITRRTNEFSGTSFESWEMKSATSILSSTIGPKDATPGRISPVALPGCVSAQTDDFAITVSGSCQILTNLFASRLAQQLDEHMTNNFWTLDEYDSQTDKDFIEEITKSVIQETNPSGNPENVIGLLMHWNYDDSLYVIHNSPTFLYGMYLLNEEGVRSKTVEMSTCKNFEKPVVQVYHV